MRHLVCFALLTLAATTPAQTPAQWRLEPIATIEGPSGADPFGVIRGLALHPDGRLAVVELVAKRVTVYNASGKPLGKIGRDGSGPGEYRQPYYAAWLGDTIAIFDPGESRVVYLTNGQKPLRVTPSQRLTGDIFVRFYPVSPTKAYAGLEARGGQVRNGDCDWQHRGIPGCGSVSNRCACFRHPSRHCGASPFRLGVERGKCGLREARGFVRRRKLRRHSGPTCASSPYSRDHGLS